METIRNANLLLSSWFMYLLCDSTQYGKSELGKKFIQLLFVLFALVFMGKLFSLLLGFMSFQCIRKQKTETSKFYVHNSGPPVSHTKLVKTLFSAFLASGVFVVVVVFFHRYYIFGWHGAWKNQFSQRSTYRFFGNMTILWHTHVVYVSLSPFVCVCARECVQVLKLNTYQHSPKVVLASSWYSTTCFTFFNETISANMIFCMQTCKILPGPGPGHTRKTK